MHARNTLRRLYQHFRKFFKNYLSRYTDQSLLHCVGIQEGVSIEERKREKERDCETGEPGAMSYHRGGQAGAVAVSYSTSPMAPHSPSRRCSSNNSGNNSSAIGTSTSKLNTYRSTASSSILDRPTNFYSTSSSTSSSSGSSGFRSNYTTEYRRSYCPSGRWVSYSLSTNSFFSMCVPPPLFRILLMDSKDRQSRAVWSEFRNKDV